MITRPFFKQFLSLSLLFISMLALSSCSTVKVGERSLNPDDSRHGLKKVLVVNSNRSVDRYQVAETTYISSLSGMQTTALDLGDEKQPIEYLQDILNQNDFDIIYCIGAKALGSIDFIDPGLPVVYNAVLNWRRFQDRQNYFGIASELSPQVQLTWFKYFFPDIKRVGVFYSQENQSFIDDANHAANNLGLNLHALKINHTGQLILSAEKLLSDVDALWLISDSSTLSSIKNVNALFKEADKYQVPIITYNPVFMDVGAMMSLVADLPTTARQAALVSMKVSEQSKYKQAIQFPAGSRIILNADKVAEYNIKLSPYSMDSVDELH